MPPAWPRAAAPTTHAAQGNRTWNSLDNTFESDASTGNEDQINKSFLVLFFKKEHEKALLFEKRSKNFC
jgi:hypothetical protein